MYELAIIIFLSISFSFIAFLFSNKMIKLFHISHPKNRFWVYAITLLTAFPIFLFPFFIAGGNQPIKEDNVVKFGNETCIQLNDGNHFSIMDGKMDGNSTEIILSKLGVSPKIHSSLMRADSKNNILINKNSSNCITGMSISSPPDGMIVFSQDKSHLLSLGTIQKNADNFIFPKDLSTFLLFNMLLALASGLYLIFSLFLGKGHLLKRLNAEKCKNSAVLHIIEEISKKLRIKMPKTFVYDGDPNAFVFGYPACLVISKKLIKCLSKEELQLTIYHELSHIKNKDTLLKPLLQAFRILFFYNPVVHLIYYKIIKERELMADGLYINSKKDKLTFMSALVKIHEYEKKKKHRNIYGSYALATIDYAPKRLELTERFNNLFGTSTKKSLHTILICAIVLLSNATLSICYTKISSYNELTMAPQTNLNITVHDSFGELKMGEKGYQSPSNINHYIFFSKKGSVILWEIEIFQGQN